MLCKLFHDIKDYMTSRIHLSPEDSAVFEIFRARGPELGVVTVGGYFTDLEEGHPFKCYAAVFPERDYETRLDLSHEHAVASYRQAIVHASPLDIVTGLPVREQSLPWDDLFNSGLLAQDSSAELAIAAAINLARERFPGRIPTIGQLMPVMPSR